MKRFFNLFAIIALLVLNFGVAGTTPAQAAGTCYVNAAASGANNGTSWANAYTSLQSAIADSCTEIWVAAGAYRPHASDRNVSFNLESGVAIYGGFPNTGDPVWGDRDPATNVTILSGDIDNNDTNADGNNIAETTAEIQGDNSIHVVLSATGGALDGFTVTAGNANVAYSTEGFGGGMYNSDGSNPTLTNVTFSGNSAHHAGGGMYSRVSSPTLTNVTFSGNSANGGGGMYNESGSPTIANVTFSGNSAAYFGGGMYNHNAGSPTLTNVTFSGNFASYGGGGIYNLDNYGTILKNVIIANNINGDCYTDDSYLNALSANNLIEDSAMACGLTDGNNGNIIGKDPQLDPLGLGDHGGSTQTIPLLSGSSAIDAGDDATCAAAPVNNLDQHGIVRPQGAHCDIGAYEYESAVTYTVTFHANGGTGTMADQVAGSPTALTLNAFTNTGYSFAGWGTAPSGPVVYADGDLYDFAADITLYAQWVDNTPPSLNLPANIIVPQTIPTGAVVNFLVTATDIVDASPSISCTPASGSVFPLGITTVNCSATDDYSNTSNDSFTVTVTAATGGNLLKKPDFASAKVFPSPWQAFGFKPPYAAALDCKIFNFGPCSVLFQAGNRSAMQRVVRSGSAGDMYSFGMYSAANNAPAGGKYLVEVAFYNNFNRQVGISQLQFNLGTHGFELVSGPAIATAKYNKITFRFYYQNPTGRAWFDDAFLYFLGTAN